MTVAVEAATLVTVPVGGVVASRVAAAGAVTVRLAAVRVVVAAMAASAEGVEVVVQVVVPNSTVAVDPLRLRSIYCTHECVGLSCVCARRESAWQYRGAQGLSRRSGSAWTPPFAQGCPGYASEPC